MPYIYIYMLFAGWRSDLARKLSKVCIHAGQTSHAQISYTGVLIPGEKSHIKMGCSS